MAIQYSKTLIEQLQKAALQSLQQHLFVRPAFNIFYGPPKQKDDQHGIDWRASAPDNGDTIDGAGDGTRICTVVPYTLNITGLTIPALEEPEPPAVPHAGIRAGEIIGHRAWLVLPGHQLCSMGHHFVWKPGQVINGDVEKMVAVLYHIPIYGGVYAFKSHNLCMGEYESLRGWTNSHLPDAVMVGDTKAEVLGLAFGTVKLWGEVVEHDWGYRAQHARINSIDEAWGHAVELPLLQGKYFV